MTAESALYTLLSTAPGVTALVSTRIYPDLIPEEKAVPYIGYERTDAQPVATLEGTVLAWRISIMVACWSLTRVQANSIADAVLAALAGTAWRFDGSGSEVDEATGRLAATLQLSISL
jgi:hypothetical protein